MLSTGTVYSNGVRTPSTIGHLSHFHSGIPVDPFVIGHIATRGGDCKTVSADDNLLVGPLFQRVHDADVVHGGVECGYSKVVE